MTLNPEFSLIPEKLHEALLTSPATKADASSHMITTGGLTLSQTVIEIAIDRIISDLFDQLILSTADYATLLTKHQVSPAASALRELKTSGAIMLLKHERDVAQAVIDDATAEFIALSQAQKNAIPDIKAAADEGILFLTSLIFQLDDKITQFNIRRNFGF